MLRRLSFDLTGLPPTAEEIAAFLSDDSEEAYETVVERLLASPHFGERWARHWMDLFRYTESHGSEGDPDIPEAWRYRDYLIRAFNSDVPYDQLILEHLAGDLLPQPRLNELDGLNESLLGTAHYRMIEHGFQPVDPLEDRVKWTDNQIDVFSKAFQGLTVSCARCHDHKFDAISQRDYYALYGVFASARPVQRAVDVPDVLHTHKDALRATKVSIRDTLASLWLASAEALPARLHNGDETLDRAIESAACDPDSLMYPWTQLSIRTGDDLGAQWHGLVAGWEREVEYRERFNSEEFGTIWRPTQAGTRWIRIGTGLEGGASSAGEFSIVPNGGRILSGIYEPGVYSGLLSARHDGVLQTPRFMINTDRISFRVQGSGLSFVRLIVENYAVPRAGIYWQRYSPKKDSPVWAGWDTTYWKGFSAYVEFAPCRTRRTSSLIPSIRAESPGRRRPRTGVRTSEPWPSRSTTRMSCRRRPRPGCPTC